MGLFGTSKTNWNTPLSQEQQVAYQQWRARLPENLQSESDYDLRGAYLANAKAAGNGHMTDQFKKPNHMTFSDGSQYSTPQQPGGQWVEDGKGGYVFWASPTNLQNHSLPEMARYFNEVEQGSNFVAPINFDLRNTRRR